MDLIDRRLAHLHHRRRVQRAFDAWMPWAALSLGLAAVAVMVVRLGAPALAWAVPTLVAAGALAALPMAARGWRRRDPPELLAGHLDELARAQGLAMALAADDARDRDADWAARLRRPLETVELPAWRWAAARPMLVAGICLAVAVALPQASPTATMPPSVANLFAPLAARIDEAAAERLLPRDDEQAARARLEELEAHASGSGMDQTLWDGLDRLDRDLDAADDAAAQRLAAALVEAETQADAAGDQAATPGSSAQMLAALAELAAQAPGLVPTLPEGADAAAMQAALAEAAANGLLSPEHLQALQRAGLRGGKEMPGGMDDAARRALAKRLAEQLAIGIGKLRGDDGGSWEERLERERGGRGRGRGRRDGEPGVGRGPGHEPLSFEDRARLDGGAVDGLPPGARLNPDGSVTLAEQQRGAELDEAALHAATRAAARAFDPGAADARRTRVAPRHRATIERYFASTPSVPAAAAATPPAPAVPPRTAAPTTPVP